jgi:DNA-binding CsgD family transcriptional regulator
MGIHSAAVTELLERERELGVLDATLARVQAGSGAAILIEGPPGAGKSVLLASARAEARRLGLRVLEARGAVLEHDFAFGVARQLFEHELTLLDTAEREAAFAGAAGLAAQLLDAGAHAPGADYGERSFGAVHALYWLTVNLADRGPMCLAIDDAYLADPASLQFLDYLARRLEGLPVALLATGRAADPEGDELWRALAEEPAIEVIRPQPLSEAATAAFVRERLGSDCDPEFCHACHRATAGNPLFLRELIAAAREAGLAPTREAAAAVTELGPPAVGRFVLHRLRRLGPEAIALTQALAVLGGDAELALGAAAAGLGVAEAREVADLLVRAEVLAPEQRLRFVHPVVRAAIYEDLLPGERAARHELVADLLDQEGAPAERVAAHILESAPSASERSIEVLRAAAEDALARADPRAAAAYLRRALEESPAPDLRVHLLCDLGRWELASQDYEQGREHLAAVLDGAASLEARSRAATWLGNSVLATGGTRSAQATLEKMLATLRELEGDQGLELEAAATVVCRLSLALRGQVPERLAALERRAATDRGFGAVARVHVAAERLRRGDPAAELADEVESALGALDGVQDPWVLGVAIETLVLCERYPSAERWLELAMQAARALGLGPRLAAAHAQRALLALLRGSVGEAELDSATGLELAGAGQFALPRIVGVAIQTAVERAELARGRELVDAHAGLFDGDRLFLDDLLTARGRLQIAEGKVQQGLADLLRAGELLNAYGSTRPADWRADAVTTLMAAGEGEQARQLAEEGLLAARRFGAPRALARALRSAGVAVGGSDGLELLEQAVSVAGHSSARLETAYARTDLGAELVRRRQRREGREILRLALEDALKCGATALADRVRAELATGGGRPARLELRGIDALTPAERRVCELAAGDLTNREVAQTLFVTEKTVELHLTSAYRKLGIRSRFQLASVIPAPVSAG